MVIISPIQASGIARLYDRASKNCCFWGLRNVRVIWPSVVRYKWLMQTRVRQFISTAAFIVMSLCRNVGVADKLSVAGDVSRLTASQLEQQLADVDSELQSLSRFSLRNEVSAIGNRSATHDVANASEWIQIDFGNETSFDEIILVPTLWRDTDDGFQADGFPVEFRIIAGNSDVKSGSVLASYTKANHLLPRLAPVIVPCPGTMAAWVRIEASQLSRRQFDGKFILQLSEILVFNGQENVALHKPVLTSSRSWRAGGARDDRFIVDGYVPYLMDAGNGPQSLPFITVSPADEQAVLTIDLLQRQPVSQIQLHSVDTSDTAPRSTPADFGIPRHLLVEGASDDNFSDPVTLCDIRVRSIFDVSPIMTRQFDETECRYVRLTAIEPYVLPGESGATARLGFAEIEVFSAGRNVALGKTVTDSHAVLNRSRPIVSLTDGRNLYGNILPVREWLNELARRHDLEAARPRLAAELNVRYAGQKSMLRWVTWLAGLLIVGIALTFVLNGRIRSREIAAMRRRFAADLHDELGANLHTIGLLSDLAQESHPSSEDYTNLLSRIRTMTARSSSAIRFWADVQEADEFCTDLVSDMQRAAERIVVHLEHDFHVQGQESLEQLNSRTRVDVLLFYKECLVNICRHSEATHLRTELHVSPRELRLAVIDNGRGMSQAAGDGVPASLRRRAQLFGADVAVELPPDGGTGILLTLPVRKRRHR